VLDRLIDDAVEHLLVADVPVGLFLSGGIDSSLLAHAAHHRATGCRAT
jgi:asparagine synthetase B (glutamine-hydrolysing)